jgi:hypothetical protein
VDNRNGKGKREMTYRLSSPNVSKPRGVFSGPCFTPDCPRTATGIAFSDVQAAGYEGRYRCQDCNTALDYERWNRPVFVVIGGDLVTATFSESVAATTALAYAGANLDVETLTCSIGAWREKGRPTALKGVARLTDLTEGQEQS